MPISCWVDWSDFAFSFCSFEFLRNVWRDQVGAAQGDVTDQCPGVLGEVIVSSDVLDTGTAVFFAQHASHIAFQQSLQTAKSIVMLAAFTAATPIGLGVLPEVDVVALPAVALFAPTELQGAGSLDLLMGAWSQNSVGGVMIHITFSIRRIAVW